MPSISFTPPAILLTAGAALLANDYRQLGPVGVLLVLSAGMESFQRGTVTAERLRYFLRWQTLVQLALLLGIAAWGISINQDRLSLAAPESSDRLKPTLQPDAPKSGGGLMGSRGYGSGGSPVNGVNLNQQVEALKSRNLQKASTPPPRTQPPNKPVAAPGGGGGSSGGRLSADRLKPLHQVQRLPGVGPNAKALPPGLVPKGPLPAGVQPSSVGGK
jgi:hypothetical protein